MVARCPPSVEEQSRRNPRTTKHHHCLKSGKCASRLGRPPAQSLRNPTRFKLRPEGLISVGVVGAGVAVRVRVWGIMSVRVGSLETSVNHRSSKMYPPHRLTKVITHTTPHTLCSAVSPRLGRCFRYEVVEPVLGRACIREYIWTLTLLNVFV